MKQEEQRLGESRCYFLVKKDKKEMKKLDGTNFQYFLKNKKIFKIR